MQTLKPDRHQLTRLIEERKKLKSSRNQSRNPEKLLVQQNRRQESDKNRLHHHYDNVEQEVDDVIDQRKFNEYNK